MSHCLDLETGQTSMVDDEIYGVLDDLYVEPDDAGLEPPYNLAEILRASGCRFKTSSRA
jgi:hypothetical protein